MAGNYPDDYSQAAFDAYWGKPTSSDVEDELKFQLEVQDMRAALLTKLKKHKATLGAYLNEELEGALEDAKHTQAALLEVLIEEEAENAADKAADAAEYRFQRARDEQMESA